jgi:hypothetical protein
MPSACSEDNAGELVSLADLAYPADMHRSALVFDIETIGDVDTANRDAIAALIRNEGATPEHYAALCPPLARVACVAWYETATTELTAIYDASLGSTAETVSGHVEGSPCTLKAAGNEADLLRVFGAVLEAHAGRPNPLLVTFNGRGFDLPVLLHRGVKHGVSRGRSVLRAALSDNRYTPARHLDLLDALTFQGATRRYPLAAYVLGYGLPSPKENMAGAGVGAAVAAGRIKDVARYCAGDVVATLRVYRRWIGESP